MGWRDHPMGGGFRRDRAPGGRCLSHRSSYTLRAVLTYMTRTTCHMSISLDGFVAGPKQDRDNPVGVGGFELHEWHWHAGEPGHEVDAGPRDELLNQRGAYVMGHNMFGPI